ncbi:AAA family ATPase [Niabella ginsenosidivorans]|uniref:AAA family ATPase n=1 Tax=Niabella ginsenosidivorans TaxID=1176587 RepID=A0A1A9HYW0_9BACT|nr:helix-turn-helix domain-containing protein [Niabella ginsenosidivorans]ANH79612.1 AAA family ATPase [Niabella ginsenosidivorans]
MTEKIFNIIEYTQRSVFLTGKAGTGKTTFLNEFTKKTTKKHMVAAPTGIAAINAGGVTLHSLFGLPLITFAPTTEPVDRNEAINIPQLLPHFKYRKEKLKLLRALELLIIDEVSMLRADVLDMIDWALKSARRSTQAFGGVQLLLIGDLYQLPPVVKQSSEAILGRYYAAPYFFESKALQITPFITVELSTIYRQSDPEFISLLNAIRNGEKDAIDFELLNQRYRPGFEPENAYVYLVSHNYMADAINAKELKALPGKGTSCKAVINGDFKEHLYPNDPELLLKPDAQVMFIRNDTSEEKKYYNGRLAKVLKIKPDAITVLPDDSATEIVVEREVWEHKRYYLDDKKEIEEEIVGSYEQFPFRLAWAVTIHKSQGLTFDNVIIDAGQSFTSGQVYVALSRCRTLKGIVLKSPIRASNIFKDERIADFHKATNASEKIEDIYAAEKNDFAISKLLQVLSTARFSTAIEEWIHAGTDSHFINQEDFIAISALLKTTSRALERTFNNFEQFLKRQLQNTTPGSWSIIEDKSSGAVNYFFKQVYETIFIPFRDHYSTTKGVKGLKAYNTIAKTVLDELEEYLNTLKTVHLLDKNLFIETESTDISVEVTKKPSHIISYELLEEGKTAAEIAALRNLSVSTIYGHFAKVAVTGIIDVEKLFSPEQLQTFCSNFKPGEWASLTEAKTALPAFEFHELRVLINHFTYFAGKEKKNTVKQSL